MSIVFLILGVTLSAASEFLAAALLDLRQSVFSALADEGSKVGMRFRRAYDNVEETSLSISLLDLLGITLATFSVATFWNGSVTQMALQVAGFIVAISVLKIIAATIGARYGEHLLRPISIFLVSVRILTLPAVFMHTALMRLTHREDDEEEAREELEAVVETAREEGALDPGEYRIMTNIMRLSSVSVSDVMTPRTVVFSLPSKMTIGEALKMPELQMFSRFPVFEENDLDSVSGYVIAKDVLRAALAGRNDEELTKLVREVRFVPENITLERTLEQFLQEHHHLFMVVDEHGGVEGVITMEDVLETMLGVEIVDEADRVVDLRQLAKQQRDQRIARIGEKRAQTTAGE